MADLTQVSDASLLAALKSRSDSKIAEALPHVEALLKILDPENSVLQGTPADIGAKAVHQACNAFKRSVDQMITASNPSPTGKSLPATSENS